MVQQPVEKLWKCKKTTPYRAFFVTNDPEEAKNARKKGYKCTRWHEMEKE